MIESNEHKNNLLNLARRLKYEWHSVPTDENGEPTETYLEYLSLMFDSKIAEIIQALEFFPKMMSIVKFSKKVNMDKIELKEKLDDVAKKGYLVNIGKQYSLPSPLILWDSPFIYKRNYDDKNAKKIAELGLKFFYDEGYYKKWETTRDGTPRQRILTVSEEVEPKDEIVPIEEIYKIIDQNTDITLIPCPCRNRQEINGTRECKDKYPIHTCIALGIFAKGILEYGDPVTKAITQEEAKEIARQASELGLVHTTDNVGKNCRLICACCECCCIILRGLTQFDNPRAVARANYIAHVDEDTCVGCGTCVERCKFGAITLDETSKINIDKCMGCGLCAVKCPEDAITMKRFEREQVPLEREEIEILD
jgi:ferredoxin